MEMLSHCYQKSFDIFEKQVHMMLDSWAEQEIVLFLGDYISRF